MLNQSQTSLFGELSPAAFMRQHWQTRPLLIRQAIAGFRPLLSREALFALAGQDDVESRLLRQSRGKWALSRGPFDAADLPSLKQKAWTLLVQGVNLHEQAVADLMSRFRFIPDARLDDVMISYASDGGGVGPHYDSYDVFLLQASGKRHWRIGRQKDLSLVAGMPLKILQNFEPEQEFTLEAGDMLYLPPRWAHDGVALGGDCMTYSIGFRKPREREVLRSMLQGLLDELDDDELDANETNQQGAQSASHGVNPSVTYSKTSETYSDAKQDATQHPAQIPETMQAFASQALVKKLTRILQKPESLLGYVGESLSEPKAQVWFEAEGRLRKNWLALSLHRKSQMLYDARQIYINGESWRVSGKEAKCLRQLADSRSLSRASFDAQSADLQNLLLDWYAAGWLVAVFKR